MVFKEGSPFAVILNISILNWACGLHLCRRRRHTNFREVFDECKLRILDGDEAFYFRHDENGDLEGMVSSHVDDFFSGWNQ